MLRLIKREAREDSEGVLPEGCRGVAEAAFEAREIGDGAVFRGRSGRLSIRQAQYRFREVLAAAEIERPAHRAFAAPHLRDEAAGGDGRSAAGAGCAGHRQLADDAGVCGRG